jgi:hypothetical protein
MPEVWQQFMQPCQNFVLLEKPIVQVIVVHVDLGTLAFGFDQWRLEYVNIDWIFLAGEIFWVAFWEIFVFRRGQEFTVNPEIVREMFVGLIEKFYWGGVRLQVH